MSDRRRGRQRNNVETINDGWQYAALAKQNLKLDETKTFT